ncbi:hypothetical protein BKA80DRAFT_263095 [Phyllosticta citrichinensis]
MNPLLHLTPRWGPYSAFSSSLFAPSHFPPGGAKPLVCSSTLFPFHPRDGCIMPPSPFGLAPLICFAQSPAPGQPHSFSA